MSNSSAELSIACDVVTLKMNILWGLVSMLDNGTLLVGIRRCDMVASLRKMGPTAAFGRIFRIGHEEVE
ncbi:MAG: hypothetical protein OXD33_03505 [Rhodobacteraceae bacterium]|nr:hypothetical protein [Paracoccaceae bacterium]